MADEFVQSLARGLSVITAFDATHPAMTLSAVAARAGLSRATARRLLHTLVELGYVRVDGSEFALTPQVLRLGTAYLAGLGLPEVAQPHLAALSADVGESTSAAILDGDEIVYVARVASSHRLMRVGITVGTRFPAWATSMGRVLLADRPGDPLPQTTLTPLTPRTVTDRDRLLAVLTETREQGWTLVDEELEVGLRSLAVPVRTADGVVAAVNISMHAGPDNALAHLDRLRAAAAAISDDLAVLAR
ncbi:IclR family transcriptional regulator domain-containing protein [Williamsia sp. MIQD14]|uniref:IclR family transcriptional regulator domain-containing protein n=1 Tax=Williamsia sp. MIQD14 TaxID=3425703 RepID=UPI003DA0A8BF